MDQTRPALVQALAGRRPGEHPTRGLAGDHVRTELRRRSGGSHDLECAGVSENRPGVVAVPTRELHQFVEDPGPIAPGSPFLGGHLLLVTAWRWLIEGSITEA